MPHSTELLKTAYVVLCLVLLMVFGNSLVLKSLLCHYGKQLDKILEAFDPLTLTPASATDVVKKAKQELNRF